MKMPRLMPESAASAAVPKQKIGIRIRLWSPDGSGRAALSAADEQHVGELHRADILRGLRRAARQRPQPPLDALGDPEALRRQDAPVTRDDPAVRLDQHRDSPAPLLDACGDLRHLLLGPAVVGLAGRRPHHGVDQDQLPGELVAGQVVAGFGKVEDALNRNETAALIHASDGAADGIRKLDAILRQRGEKRGESPVIAVVNVLTSEELDLALGRSNVIHAALLAGPASKAFLSRCQMLVRYRMADDDKTAEAARNSRA